MATQKISIAPILNKVPSGDTLENRFCFVDDILLRINLAITLKHVVLLSLMTTYIDLPGNLLFSIYKDMIIHTASIVEACLNYSLRKLILKNIVKESEVMPLETKYTNPKLLYKISNQESICGITQYNLPERFTNTTQFKSINKACFKAKIIDNSLFQDVEKIRSMRNHIHLASLKNDESYYTTDDVDMVFKITNKVLIQLEEILR